MLVLLSQPFLHPALALLSNAQPYPKAARVDACVVHKDEEADENPFDTFYKKKVILANGTQWAS